MRRYFDVILATVVVAVLATGTVLEKFHGNEYATTHIYGAWWFYLLMGLVALYALWSIVKHRLWRVPHKLFLYSSAVLILFGGALTSWTGKHGSVVLRPGVSTSSYMADNAKELPLPFALTLDHFDVVKYPGTKTPMDFESHLRVDGCDVVISMNNILRHKGYRFYQEDYDDEGNSTLSVSRDPWGIGVTYAGYIAMFLGIIVFFVSVRRDARKPHLHVPPAVIALLLLSAFHFLTVTSVSAAPRTLPRATADRMGQLHVLYKGRVCPLQTLAKDFTTKLCGSARYEGLTPEQVLSGWMFFFDEWAAEPMIKVKGDDVRQLLGGKRASYNDFWLHQDEFGTSSGMPAMMPPVAGQMKSKTMRAAGEKYSIIQMLIGGKFVKMFPVADSTGAIGWYAQNDDLPISTPDDDYFFIRKSQSYCQELVVKGDYEELERVFDKMCQYQQKHADAVIPARGTDRAERLYNWLTTGKWFAMMLVMLGLLSFAVSLLVRKQGCLRTNATVSFVFVILVTLFLLLIFILRWIAGGHIPMAGGFDSMNLMSIVIGLLAIIPTAFKRLSNQQSNSIALLAIGFCQLVAMMSGSNPPVTHLMPVLSSPLLTLHVTVIMISYALFFFLALNSLVALVLKADNVNSQFPILHPLAVSLLAIGIAIGALWANISWGNYWSWDPKEVWALITLIVYLFPLLHPMRHRASQVYCLIAFISVIITYFGVNLILGGIHAYN